MSLVSLITEDVVKVPMGASTKDAVFTELLDLLVTAGRVTDRERALNALLERESQGSTGLESGVAVPHAKTDAVSKLTLAVGTAPEGIPFDSLDGEPSRIFFLMLAPPDQAGPHIEALAEIARLAKSPAFLKALINAASPSDLIELLSE